MSKYSPAGVALSPSINQRWLVGFALLVVAMWLAAWLVPGVFVLPTVMGDVELFIPLTSVYMLTLGIITFNVRLIYLANGLLIVAIGMCVLHIIAFLALMLPGHTAVWDDAFMFMRYITNMREHGIIAWNVSDGPAYGATEFLYLWLVYGITLFTGLDAPHQALQIAASLGGFVFLALIAVMVWRMVRWHTTGKLLVLFLIALGMVFHTPAFTMHFISGMGTTFVMSYLMMYLLLAHWFEQTLSTRSLFITGIWGGLAFFARPDLMIFTATIPLAVWVFTENSRKRGMALGLGLVTGCTLLLALLFARIGLGSALPLPFYVKSGDFYGTSMIYATVGPIPTAEIDAYYLNNQLYLCLLALGLLMPRRVARRWGLVGWGALTAGLIYIFYFRFFVLHIMGYFQRFYYPSLPVIIYLTIGALIVLEYLPLWRWRVSRQAVALGLATALVIGCFCVPMPFFGNLATAFSPARNWYEQPTREVYSDVWSRYWAELSKLVEVQCQINLATTEVGIPSVLRPDWYIYDLSGLNNPDIVFRGFSVDRFLATKPDLIYLPQVQFYTEILYAIETHPIFKADYEFFHAPEVESAFDMAVRRASPCYPTIRRILKFVQFRTMYRDNQYPYMVYERLY